MSSPEPNSPPYGPPQGQPGYGAPQQAYGAPQQVYGAPQQGYGAPQPGYGPPAPQGYGGYGGPAPQRPGMATAAAIVGIVWGGLGTLFGLLVMLAAFGLGAAFVGLIALVSLVFSALLLWAGIKVLQGQSPRLLLIISYVAIGLGLLSIIASAIQDGGSAASGVLGLIIPGVVAGLLLQPPVKQYYAARGQAY